MPVLQGQRSADGSGSEGGGPVGEEDGDGGGGGRRRLRGARGIRHCDGEPSFPLPLCRRDRKPGRLGRWSRSWRPLLCFLLMGWAGLAGPVPLTISANVGWAPAHIPAAWPSWLRSYQEIDEVLLLNLEDLLPSKNSVHSSFGDISHETRAIAHGFL